MKNPYRKRGATLVLSILWIPFLLLIVAFAMSVGFQTLARAQLATATDSASHAGAVAGGHAYLNANNEKQAIVSKPEALPAGDYTFYRNAAMWKDTPLNNPLTNPLAFYNPPGMHPGLSENYEYGAGEFWVISTAHYQEPFLPQMLSQVGVKLDRDIYSTAMTQVFPQ